MPSRFYSQRDIDTFDKFNKELVGNLSTGADGIINQEVIVYKVSVYVQLVALVEADDQTTTTDEFGPDLQQLATFSFVRQSLVDLSFVVEIGDVINWNDGYWEISSVNENQLIGGQTSYDHSVVCSTFLVRISNLNIERVRSI